jgi:hypothetical protein
VITRANEGGAWERRLHRKERPNVRAAIETLGALHDRPHIHWARRPSRA